MIHLKELACKGGQNQELSVQERLPSFIMGPCSMRVSYEVQKTEKCYLVHLSVSGEIKIMCQRCLEPFQYPYSNNTIVAVCTTDELAEEMMENYESVVAPNGQVELEDLVIDELHLYAPEFHPNEDICVSDIMRG